MEERSSQGLVCQDVMAVELPRATHSGVLRLVDVVLECHVLSNGQRVIAKRDVLAALAPGSGITELSEILAFLPDGCGTLGAHDVCFLTQQGRADRGIEAAAFEAIIRAFAEVATSRTPNGAC